MTLIEISTKLDKVIKLVSNADFTQCQRCDGVGYYEGCADTDCSTYILHKIREVVDA